MQVLSFAVVFVCKVNVSFDSVYMTSPSHRDDDNNDDNDREIVFTRYESLSFAKDKFKFYAKRIRNCGRARFRLLFITCENASLAVRFRTCNSLSLFLSCSGLHCRSSSTTSYLSLSFRTRAI